MTNQNQPSLLSPFYAIASVFPFACFPLWTTCYSNCTRFHTVNILYDNSLTGITPGSNTAWQKLTAFFCGGITERYDADDDFRKQIQQRVVNKQINSNIWEVHCSTIISCPTSERRIVFFKRHPENIEKIRTKIKVKTPSKITPSYTCIDLGLSLGKFLNCIAKWTSF